MHPRLLRPLIAAGAAMAAGATPASADVIFPGLYRLHNHPDANARPPQYGARFDELFNATSNHDIFTLDFDHLDSQVFMTVGTNSVHIFGQAFGGRDIGNDYANDQYRGIYLIDFTYSVGLAPAPGDDDLWVASPTDHVNFGSITPPAAANAGQAPILLTDQQADGYSFRLGDEDNDAGHRGFDGISGWGWMSYLNNGQSNHIDSTDWIFIATPNIPPAGSGVLVAIGSLSLLRRRR